MKDIVVAQEDAFWLKGGKSIRSLTGLIDELRSIERTVFKHHVDGEKNDFAIWIEKAMHRPELAHQIENVKKPSSMVKILEKHLDKKARRARHISPNHTKLHLRHADEEANKTLVAASYVALGLVSGVAITLLVIALT